MARAKNPAEALHRWGYINPVGRFVIPPAFEGASRFSEGVATVIQNGLEGVIDPHGHWVLPPSFASLGRFLRGLCSAERDGKWGYIDHAGEFVIAPQFDLAFGFYFDDVAKIKEGALYGYVDRVGKVVVSPRFKVADPFSGGFAAVVNPEDGGYWFIDRTGAFRFRLFGETSGFHDGWAAVRNYQDCWFIDSTGQTVLRLPKKVLAPFGFYEDLAAAEDQNKAVKGVYLMGFVDREGKWAIKPKFKFACSFHNGLARVEIGKKHGAIDRHGKMVIPAIYDELDDLDEDRLGFVLNGRTGYLDQSGKTVIPPTFVAGQQFSEGLAAVCVEVDQ